MCKHMEDHVHVAVSMRGEERIYICVVLTCIHLITGGKFGGKKKRNYKKSLGKKKLFLKMTQNSFL